MRGRNNKILIKKCFVCENKNFNIKNYFAITHICGHKLPTSKNNLINFVVTNKNPSNKNLTLPSNMKKLYIVLRIGSQYLTT